MIRLAYEEPEYGLLGQEAFRLWRELEAESGASVLLMTGGLDVGAPDAEALDGIAGTYGKLGLPYERLESDELRRRYPQFSISRRHDCPGTGGLRHPRRGAVRDDASGTGSRRRG